MSETLPAGNPAPAGPAGLAAAADHRPAAGPPSARRYLRRLADVADGYGRRYRRAEAHRRPHRHFGNHAFPTAGPCRHDAPPQAARHARMLERGAISRDRPVAASAGCRIGRFADIGSIAHGVGLAVEFFVDAVPPPARRNPTRPASSRFSLRRRSSAITLYTGNRRETFTGFTDMRRHGRRRTGSVRDDCRQFSWRRAGA